MSASLLPTRASVAILVVTLGCVARALVNSAGHSVDKFYARVRGARVAGVRVDLNQPSIKVSVAMARGFPGGTEPFLDMARRSECAAAITGTFFGIKSNLPVADLVVDGKLRYAGRRGTAFAVNWKNESELRRVHPGAAEQWDELETVLAAGPLLVHDGKVELAPHHEGFRDPGLFGMATRCAIGLRANRQLLLVAVKDPVSLWELARIMRELGCREAMNLDGGTSTGLYYRGTMLVEPGRRLVNILTVTENVPAELRARPASLLARERRVQLARARADAASRHESAGDWRGAADELEAASRIDPLPEYALQAARATERFGSRDEIAAAYERAGAALVEALRLDGAAEQFRRALQLDPGRFVARRQLVNVYRSSGQTRLAAEEEKRTRALELVLASPLESDAAVPLPPIQLMPWRGESELRSPREPAGAALMRVTKSAAWNLRFRLPQGARLDSRRSLLLVRHDLPYTIGVQALQPSARPTLHESERQHHAGSLHRVLRQSKRAIDNEPALITDCESIIDGRRVISRCGVTRRDRFVYAFSLTTGPMQAAAACPEFEAFLDSVRFPQR